VFHYTKGVLYAVLAADSGDGDPQHVRGAQGDFHGDGGPRSTSHCVPHADDAGRRLRRYKMQALHEHFDWDGHGLVHQPSEWPYHLLRAAFAAVQVAVSSKQDSTTSLVRLV